jgi:hypothetical protein
MLLSLASRLVGMTWFSLDDPSSSLLSLVFPLEGWPAFLVTRMQTLLMMYTMPISGYIMWKGAWSIHRWIVSSGLTPPSPNRGLTDAQALHMSMGSLDSLPADAGAIFPRLGNSVTKSISPFLSWAWIASVGLLAWRMLHRINPLICMVKLASIAHSPLTPLLFVVSVILHLQGVRDICFHEPCGESTSKPNEPISMLRMLLLTAFVCGLPDASRVLEWL